MYVYVQTFCFELSPEGYDFKDLLYLRNFILKIHWLIGDYSQDVIWYIEVLVTTHSTDKHEEKPQSLLTVEVQIKA